METSGPSREKDSMTTWNIGSDTEISTLFEPLSEGVTNLVTAHLCWFYDSLCLLYDKQRIHAVQPKIILQVFSQHMYVEPISKDVALL